MNLWKALFVASPLVSILHAAGTIHGPICLWHGDPTSTMMIEWIERVDARVTPNKWLEGVAGFGYADNDDETNLEMAEKFQRLYIRKEFEPKEVPRDGVADVVGSWNTTATVDKNPLTMIMTIEKEGDNFKGNAMSLLYGKRDLKDIKVTGKILECSFTATYKAKDYTVKLRGEEKEAGRIAGEWSVEGETTKDKFEAKRNKVEGEKREAPVDFKYDAFQMLVKIRYDDGFIAYLNGEEIARKGVSKGSGKDASELASHDGDKEETIEIDKKHNKLLRAGNNVLAIEGHNQKIDSSDFSLDPKFYIKTDKEIAQIDAKATWQFYLGEPSADWKTVMSKAEAPALMASNLTPFEVRYGLRGQELSKAVRAVPRAFAQSGQVIHMVTLAGLTPDSEYAYAIHEIGKSERLHGKKWFFRTAPSKLTEPLHFVTGGDMFHKRELLDGMNRVAGKQQALFALLGGDLAYANDKDNAKWYDWFDSWHQYAVNSDDTMIPMIAVIGNHECDKNIDETKDDERKNFKPEDHAKQYLSLFPMPNGKTNFVIDFAEYMSIVCLDSEHTQTAESQVPWLRETLAKRKNCPNLFVCYHRPIYGLLVKEDQADCKKHWISLFEEYGVDVAFEHDHHIYKRSHPLKKEQVDLSGVTYLGDGAWGVDVRKIEWDKVRQMEYIATGAEVNYLYRVTLTQDRQQFDAIDKDNRRFDSYIRWRH